MGKRLAKPCRKPGCAALTTDKSGYCDVHKMLAQKGKPRASASSRGYGQDWRKARLQALAIYPFCSFPGCKKFSAEVDHQDQDKTNLTLQNLRPYCKEHHRLKTLWVDLEGSRKMTLEEWNKKYPIENSEDKLK